MHVNFVVVPVPMKQPDKQTKPLLFLSKTFLEDIFSVSGIKTCFQVRHFAWAATTHSLRQIILAQNHLLQGRWCLIAFTHLAPEAKSWE